MSLGLAVQEARFLSHLLEDSVGINKFTVPVQWDNKRSRLKDIKRYYFATSEIQKDFLNLFTHFTVYYI